MFRCITNARIHNLWVRAFAIVNGCAGCRTCQVDAGDRELTSLPARLRPLPVRWHRCLCVDPSTPRSIPLPQAGMGPARISGDPRLKIITSLECPEILQRIQMVPAYLMASEQHVDNSTNVPVFSTFPFKPFCLKKWQQLAENSLTNIHFPPE